MPTMSVGERIKAARKERGLSQVELGAAIGIAQNTLSEMESGKLRNWPLHASKVARALAKPLSYFDPAMVEHMGNTPDQPESEPSRDYVSVEVLPTFAGMGGGGTGDADRETALISRRLVYDELRAHPADLLVINVRGNSMEPLFHHGDQLIVDCRDKSPTQPGPFALLYDDGYVVKNVAWVEKRSKLRISSTNPEFGPEDFDPEEVTIMGRPVWFARRL
jgi:phage repressor protein C with HTH and peptisase S24 domain